MNSLRNWKSYSRRLKNVSQNGVSLRIFLSAKTFTNGEIRNPNLQCNNRKHEPLVYQALVIDYQFLFSNKQFLYANNFDHAQR